MEHFIFSNLIQKPNILLDPDESKHVIRSLRKKKGDVLEVVDGKGNYYEASVFHPDQKKCILKIEKQISGYNERPYQIHLYIAPTKNPSRMELVVEKCTEIGVASITFCETVNTEKKRIRMERMERIAIAAIKQSKKAKCPDLSDITPFETLIKTAPGKRILATCDANFTTHKIKPSLLSTNEVSLFIGPEGDFTSNEINLAIQNKFELVTLSQSILRTETAAITGCVLLNDCYDEKY